MEWFSFLEFWTFIFKYNSADGNATAQTGPGQWPIEAYVIQLVVDQFPKWLRRLA